MKFSAFSVDTVAAATETFDSGFELETNTYFDQLMAEVDDSMENMFTLRMVEEAYGLFNKQIDSYNSIINSYNETTYDNINKYIFEPTYKSVVDASKEMKFTPRKKDFSRNKNKNQWSVRYVKEDPLIGDKEYGYYIQRLIDYFFKFEPDPS